MNPSYVNYPLRDRRGWWPTFTTLRIDGTGRVVGTWTLGRTACCEGADTPAVVSMNEAGLLLQLQAGSLDDRRSELRSPEGYTLRRELLRPGSMDEEGNYYRIHPALMSTRSGRYNGHWLNEREWVVLDGLVGIVYRCYDLQPRERVLGPDLETDLFPYYDLVPGPDRSWAVLGGDTSDRFASVTCCDADCAVQWIIPSAMVNASLTDAGVPEFFPIGQLQFCLDSAGQPVFGWETSAAIGDADPSVASLNTDGSLRWSVGCPVPWLDFPEPTTKTDAVVAIAPGAEGRVAVLWERQQSNPDYDPEVPEWIEPYRSTALSMIDADGNAIWSVELIPWWRMIPAVNVSDVYAPHLRCDGERVYFSMTYLMDSPDDRASRFYRWYCLDAGDGAGLWSRQFKSHHAEDDGNIDTLFARAVAVVPGGGLLLGFEPFFATWETRRP